MSLTRPRVQLLCGDALEVLRGLPSESVSCVVTSPPYLGLRDYGLPPSVWGGDTDCEHEWSSVRARGRYRPGNAPGELSTSSLTNPRSQNSMARPDTAGDICGRCGAWRGCLGLEPTPDLYIEHMVTIFRELRRVLRADGVAWVNMGDGWAGGGCGARDPGLKTKDLVGAPWMLAFALRADGWYLRAEVIWEKPTAMPESVTDRPTRSHEQLFLLAKSARYWYDAFAIREAYTTGDTRPPIGPHSLRRGEPHPSSGQRLKAPSGWDMGPGGHGALTGRYRSGNKVRRIPAAGEDGRLNAHLGIGFPWEADGTGRNARTVWRIGSRPFKGAHFATDPPELVERCVLAGCPDAICATCGTPRRRVTRARYVKSGAHGAHSVTGRRDGGDRLSRYNDGRPRIASVVDSTGWTDCGCGAGWVAGTVLDPFVGSGTTAMVAARLGRNAIGIDLNPEYIAMVERRVAPYRDQTRLSLGTTP